MKRKLIVGVLSAVLALVLSAPAQALIVTPADAQFETDDQSGNPGTSDLLALAGLTEADLLYKDDGPTGGAEGGDFADSYATTYFNTPTDPSEADITYTTPNTNGSITCPECWLLVKDGNAEPAQYLINIDEWNGTDTLELQGFWPNGGAISHVSIYSAPGETTSTTVTSETTTATVTSETTQATVTPEPATLALLGSGLAITAARLRRRKKV